MCQIFGHSDRNCHAWMRIDLGFFVKEMFEELIAVTPPPPPKKTKMVSSSPDPQVHCYHLSLVFCSKQRNVIIIVW